MSKWVWWCEDCDMEVGDQYSRKYSGCMGGKVVKRFSTERPEWDEYFLNIAKAVSQRADCRRAQHGAVIVNKNRVVATGYNGSPAGDRKSCLAGDCPRGLLSYEEQQSLTGDYDLCLAIHAESNALVYANRGDCVDATIYVTGKPCPGCEKLIRASGIRRIVWPDGGFWV